jgi:hypothetical protein
VLCSGVVWWQRGRAVGFAAAARPDRLPSCRYIGVRASPLDREPQYSQIIRLGPK